MNSFVAVIEAGGTKFNCAIVNKKRKILVSQRIETTTPEKTIAQVIDFFEKQKKQYPFTQLGLATFGPIDLDEQSANFGSITQTPKPHWSNTPLVTMLESGLGCKVIFDTDVNAAALAEFYWGNAQNTRVSVYVTVGTGIGGGIIVNGEILHGLLHPEMGHMLVPMNQQNSHICPYHDDCLTAAAAGPAIEEYWHQSASEFEPSHSAWDCQVDYLAKMCHNLLVILAPQKIILGGGVMQKAFLLPRIILKTSELLNGYMQLPQNINFVDIIVTPKLGINSGLLGALALVLASNKNNCQ